MRRPWRGVRLLCLLACLLGWSARADAQSVLKCSGSPPPQAVSGTGWPIRPIKVYVGNSSSNLVGGYTDFVTASIASGPGGGQISGGVTVQAISENVPGLGLRSVATFSNLIITGQGDYQIQFTAPGLSSCTTSTFTVGPSYHPGSSSGARGLGTAIPGIVVTDFDGFAVPQSGQIDAGAMQYRTPGTPAPTCPPNCPTTCPAACPTTCLTPTTCPGGNPTTGPIPPPQNFRVGN